MELIRVLCLLLLIIHLMGLMINKGKFLNRMVRFIREFKKQDLINQSDYDDYMQRFNGLFNFIEPIPYPDEFKDVNGNAKFESFLEGTRKRNKYFLIGSGISFLLKLIFDLL